MSESKEIINLDVAKILGQMGISLMKFKLTNEANPTGMAWDQAGPMHTVSFSKVLKPDSIHKTGNMEQL